MAARQKRRQPEKYMTQTRLRHLHPKYSNHHLKILFFSRLVFLIFFASLGSNYSMANTEIQRANCPNPELANQIMERYRKAGKRVKEVNSDRAYEVSKKGKLICILSDSAGSVHSYSKYIYEALDDRKHYLIFVGGISGYHYYGYGPI